VDYFVQYFFSTGNKKEFTKLYDIFLNEIYFPNRITMDNFEEKVFRLETIFKQGG
jgi:Zn-dependent M16 (insulinase) family peptidase